jgi:hypothetical protein
MSGRKPQPTTDFVKGVTMPALDTIDDDQADCIELHSAMCTVSHTFESRFTTVEKLNDEDFLTWSRRQKDAENIQEYDE